MKKATIIVLAILLVSMFAFPLAMAKDDDRYEDSSNKGRGSDDYDDEYDDSDYRYDKYDDDKRDLPMFPSRKYTFTGITEAREEFKGYVIIRKAIDKIGDGKVISSHMEITGEISFDSDLGSYTLSGERDDDDLELRMLDSDKNVVGNMELDIPDKKGHITIPGKNIEHLDFDLASIDEQVLADRQPSKTFEVTPEQGELKPYKPSFFDRVLGKVEVVSKSAYWACYDGTETTEYSQEYLTLQEWQEKAREFCETHPGKDKTGVNTFKFIDPVYMEVDSGEILGADKSFAEAREEFKDAKAELKSEIADAKVSGEFQERKAEFKEERKNILAEWLRRIFSRSQEVSKTE